MTERRMQSPMSAAEKRAAWGDFAAREDEYLDEVEQRWGATDAYAESARKVAAYGPAEWTEINAGNAAVESTIRDLMDAGADPRSEAAMDAAEAQRAHISRWFYAMDHDFHVAKSDLYVQDPRFRESIEKNTRAGAAEWLQAAIIANAERHAGQAR
jgi:hypothetical protein